jgi:hypothetical protein
MPTALLIKRDDLKLKAYAERGRGRSLGRLVASRALRRTLSGPDGVVNTYKGEGGPDGTGEAHKVDPASGCEPDPLFPKHGSSLY